MKKYLAEFIGTFALVFCGTGAIIIDQQTHGAVGHVGISLTFGLIVLAMIYTFGDVSGAHLNPAVSVGFWLAKRFPAAQLAPYIGAQLAGALLASGIWRLIFPDNTDLGGTAPMASSASAVAVESILTFLLMLVILAVSSGSKELGTMAGIAVGATVGLEALFAGPFTGASMNPARSLAPALVSRDLSVVWIYLLAPVLGALGAALAWGYFKPRSASGT
ncbi:MAG: aquaporin [Flavobacteriales bacterium]|nr:aquaporin [Flavobacteriales bacterium]